jgi:endonuclease/exonuclease/phosphatase family metal-dependent hydrolase
MTKTFRTVPAAAVIALVVAAIVRGDTRQPQQSARQVPTRPLKVMTYNIKHGQTNKVCAPPAAAPDPTPPPDCNLDLGAAAAVIRAHAPDIVGLQEVDRFWARSGMQDEPAILSSAVSLTHSCYAANLDHGPDAHSRAPHQYGTLVLSRFPILECTNTALPRTEPNEQRGLSLALIDLGTVRLRFYNTHLHTTAADRLLQGARIASVLDAAAGALSILTGDFNARPNAPELAPVQQRLVDAWAAAGRPTAENPDGHTSPSRPEGNPRNRIDYIFVSRQIGVESAVVPLDASTRMASDHYPVIANLKLPASAGEARFRP